MPDAIFKAALGVLVLLALARILSLQDLLIFAGAGYAVGKLTKPMGF